MSQSEAVTTTPGGGPGFFEKARDFLIAVRAELGKVNWPTKDELIKATRMVVIFAMILGVIIGLLDWFLNLILVTGVARLVQ